MRRLLLLVSLVAGLALSAAPAFGHVHAVTPLNVCNVDNANSGANRADDEDNPITGFIPTSVGNAEQGNVPTAGGGPADDNVQCP